MDRIFGSGFGSQKSSKPLPPEAQLELVLIDNHLGNHLGNETMRFLAIIEVVRQRFGLSDGYRCADEHHPMVWHSVSAM